MAVRFLLERTVKSGFLKPKLGFGGVMDHYAGMSSVCCKNWNPFARTDPRNSACPLECGKDMDPRIFKSSLDRGIMPRIGGITPYKGPLDHPKIIRPARIAVEQYNEQQNTQLEFVRLLKAYIGVSVGTKFCLILEAIDAGVKNTYFVEILRNASNNCIMELESFRLNPDKKKKWQARYYTDPSGTYCQCNAKAIGSGSEGADSSLQEQYNKVIPNNVDIAKVAPTFHPYTPSKGLVVVSNYVELWESDYIL